MKVIKRVLTTTSQSKENGKEERQSKENGKEEQQSKENENKEWEEEGGRWKRVGGGVG